MEEVKKTETELVEVKTELQETKKKYVELTIKFTKTQLIGVALFSMYHKIEISGIFCL